MPQTDAQRRDEKRRRYLRSIGKPSKVYPHEYDQAVAKLFDFRSRGMTLDAMADACNHTVNAKVFSTLMCGHQVTMYRVTYDAIMSMPFNYGWRSGTRVPSVGAARRLQALRLKGFPVKGLLADMLDTKPSQLQEISAGRRRYIFYNTHAAIAQLYDKLQFADPADYGIKREHSLKAQAYTRNKGWGTVDCWDADTIDNPNAVPEWTGACGTHEGYVIHIRETVLEQNYLPLCDACKRAVEHGETVGVQKVRFDAEEFTRLLDENNLTIKQLAAKDDVYVSDQTMYKWKTGQRAPQDLARVMPVAEALGCAVRDLAVLENRTASTYDGPVTRGVFNRHALKAVMEVKQMSWNEAGRVAGVAPATVQNWIRGKSKPGLPNGPTAEERVKPLADHFGIDLEVFFS